MKLIKSNGIFKCDACMCFLDSMYELNFGGKLGKIYLCEQHKNELVNVLNNSIQSDLTMEDKNGKKRKINK